MLVNGVEVKVNGLTDITEKEIVNYINYIKENLAQEYIFVRYMGPKFVIAFSGVETNAVADFLNEMKEKVESMQIRLTEEEIRNSFNRMKDYYRNRDDNMTQREINRLKESNASVDVKDKASAFERLLTDNRSENIGTLFSYDEVSHDPFLYDKTVVVWRGAAANLYVTPTSLTFDLLVGYENRKFLEGTVPVFVDYGVKIIEGEPYEIEGEITVDGDEHFRLHALSIRRIQIN